MIRFAFFLILAGLVAAAQPLPLPGETPWDLKVLKKTPDFQWLSQKGSVHSLAYAGAEYRGKPTRTFAYYASPKTLGKGSDEKVPGIVLVHGGGGAAFENWAELWARRGYAAIAMDLAGRGAGRKPMPDGGPDQGHEFKFNTIDEPVGNQWSYHAVANVIRAHSLLRSFPEVDVGNVALTGISWGGYLTCIVAGVDDRFKVAMPVYGCGFLRENSVWKASEFGKMTQAQSDKWHRLWDPSRYIGSAKMPVMFLNGTNDFAYPMDSYARTCALVQGEKNYSIQIRMRHGHIFNFPEFFGFVDQYLRGGTPMPVVAQPVVKDGQLSATVQSKTRLITANLHYTTGPHPENKTRGWKSLPLKVDGLKVHGAAPPKEATVWYVDVRDERKFVVSSKVMGVK
ncbi:MAG: alpha/beta fold hydrolase [Verrucomicrobiales bacterium]